MRHNLYMNCNNHGVKSGGKRVGSDYSRQPPNHKNKMPGAIKKNFLSLDDLASAVLKKYKDDPDVCDEVVGKINLYRINLTIAKEYNHKESQKELTKGIRNYLYELLKKEN